MQYHIEGLKDEWMKYCFYDEHDIGLTGKQAGAVFAWLSFKIQERIDSLNTKDHTCAFNDSTQTCDCYLQAINDIKKVL